MKQTNINIDEIKRFPTVTNPIKADDLHTPQAYAYTLRRAIVTDCNDRQRAELVELLDGKDTAEGVTFQNTRANRNRLHVWQNEQSRKERAAILGDGWQWIEGVNHGTEPGNLIVCTDGTQGRVTKSSPESCCIEFETEGGQRLSVAGYFRKESPRYRAAENSADFGAGTIDTPTTYDAQHYREVLTADYWGEHAPRVFQFDGDEIEIYAPTDRRPSWLVVADIFSSPKEATLDEVADYLAARYQEDHKPMLQDSEEIKADVFRNGLTEEQAGKLTAKLSQWARMTDENNHTEARVDIAKFFGLTFQADFKELQEKGYNQGYLTMNDRETSCRLTIRMLGAIERNYSKDIADRVRKCL